MTTTVLLHNRFAFGLLKHPSEVITLAHSEMKNPVSLDVSPLITFSGKSGPPLDLCESDPGNLPVTV